MEAVNKFNSGLNQDLGYALQQDESYLDALNFRLTTEAGLSTGNPENIKGMLQSIIIPETSNVILLEPNAAYPSTPLADSLTINGTTISFTYKDNFEQELSEAINADSTLAALGITSAYKSERVTIFSQVINNLLVTPTITVVLSSGNLVQSTLISGKSGLKIIGWEVIRNSIFLLTTNEITETASGGQFWKVEYDITTDPYTYTLTLIYNNNLDFTLAHPIANPGAIKGNYESNDIQKIYWTDNYNYPRVINTADPNVMAIAVEDLRIQPLVNVSVPILQNIIQNGQVLTGVHQFAYRLKITAGAETVFSPSSALVQVFSDSETTQSYITYHANSPNLPSGKSLQYQINNLDTSYKRVEVLHMFYDGLTGVPSITEIIKDEPIPDNGSITFIYSGNEIGIPITLEEVTVLKPIIETVKTLNSKNNYLFFGNTKESIFDIDFDARAYRFQVSPSSPTIAVDSEVRNSQGTTQVVNPLSTAVYPNQWDISEEFDAINPNQDDALISPTLPNQSPYLYQYTTSGPLVFGGSGPNIRYSFVPDIDDINTQNTDADNGMIFLDEHPILNTTITSVPDVYVNRQVSTYTFDNFNRPQGTSFKNFHSPYIQSFLKGYTRGETYRFGIVFYDLNGNPGYTKWIADIRMPRHYMPDPNDPLNQSAKILTFPTADYDGAQTTKGYNLGIKFEVTLPADIQNQVSAFSIVRCDRTSADKTVLGQGIFNLAFEGVTTTDQVFLIDPGQNSTTFGLPPNTVLGAGATIADGNFASFTCPEFLFDTENFNYSNSDSVELLSTLESISYVGVFQKTDCSNVPVNAYGSKNYTFRNTLLTDISTSTTFYNADLALSGTKDVDDWWITSGPYGWTYGPLNTSVRIYNLSPGQSLTSNLVNVANQGIRTLVLRSGTYPSGNNTFSGFNTRALTDNVYSTGTNFIDQRFNIYLANYKRTVSAQYGGNTFSDRANNVYVSTNHYQTVTKGTSTYTDTIYGGDTYITIFDVSTRKRHWSGDGITSWIPPHEISNGDGNAVMRYFPVETTVNTDLRYWNGTPGGCDGGVPNKFNVGDSTGSGLDITDDFQIAGITLIQDTFRRFLVKPTEVTSDGTHDVRVRVSIQKENNELLDSWTVFQEADYIELDSTQGPLNNLIVHQDRLIGFQDKGIAVLSVNERSLIQDSSGAELVLGSGGILQRYDYISKIIGSQHQLGFTQSHDAVFFFDIRTKNLYKLRGNQPVSLTVSKGMTSYFGENLNGLILINDNPLLNKGIAATYDFHYNEAIFTFKDKIFNIETQLYENVDFTVAYNDFIDAFTSFYSFAPGVYVNDTKNIFSSNPDLNELWIHDKGNYGQFYNTYYPSTIKLLLNPYPTERKVWDTFQFETEVSTNNIEVPNETFTSIRLSNTHQDSGIRDYPGSTDIIGKKKERFWNVSQIRSRTIYDNAGTPVSVSPTNITFAERFRSPYLFAELSFDNTINNRRLVLNTWKSDFRQSAR